jgi:hypothetical protein
MLKNIHWAAAQYEALHFKTSLLQTTTLYGMRQKIFRILTTIPISAYIRYWKASLLDA